MAPRRAEGIADEAMRHAITKLAHLHLAATPQSAERIRRMGEPDHTNHTVGSPAIDDLDSFAPLSDQAWAESYADKIKGSQPSVQATKASVENLVLLQAGKGEIAFTLGDSLADAWTLALSLGSSTMRRTPPTSSPSNRRI